MMTSEFDLTGDRLRLLAEFYGSCAGYLHEALVRHVPPERLPAIEHALFDGIDPLPDGPPLVDAVERFLDRLAELKKSEVPGVQFACAAVERQGLDSHSLQRVAALARMTRATQPAENVALRTRSVQH